LGFGTLDGIAPQSHWVVVSWIFFLLHDVPFIEIVSVWLGETLIDKFLGIIH
jgi:hypothetical protein